MLDRNSILSLDDLPREEVSVPEWNGSVYVRALTGAERDQIERMVATDSVSTAKIVAMVTVDEKGAQFFTKEDVDKLEKKNGQALQRIVNAALNFNLMSVEGLEEAGKD